MKYDAEIVDHLERVEQCVQHVLILLAHGDSVFDSPLQADILARLGYQNMVIVMNGKKGNKKI
jgi:hypothetical protein